ncbi:MAG: ATP synthase F1 subunit delta [Ruminococcaceae bacterium]|nr:ATP synthase F1 subunit delta [Oscillospiraceae bacterium]
MIDVGKEYGAALFMLACERNKKKEYAGELKLIEEAFKESTEYAEFLSSPSIPVKERLSAIESAFAGSLSEDVLSFFLLLCEKGRMPCLEIAINEYNALLDASERISTARVISAIPLTDGEKAKLKEKLEVMYKRTVNLECSVDENVLGGLIVEVDGNTMDGSLRYRLREVKEVMNR